MVIPMIVGVITVGGTIMAMATGTRGGVAAGMAGFGLGMLVTFALSLAFSYVAAAALVNFVHKNRLGAAFDFITLKAVLVTSEYAVAWGLSIGVVIAAGVVVSVLNGIPVLGAIIGAFVLFYAQVVAAYLWADGYTDARENRTVAEERDLDRSAI